MSSTANIVPPQETGGNEETQKARPNPVALETVVNVTGARPSGGNGSRDLFSEETKTVLVFKDGAVIGLTSPVSVGQLLFLRHKQSNQEVVCQVVHKRSFKPTMCYVELQFTEEKPDFWGVSFEGENAGGAELKGTEQVEAEETTEDVARVPVAPHSAEDVDQLKKEVEALREQLMVLEKKNAAEAAAKAAAREAAVREIAMRGTEKAAEPSDLRVSNVKLELASVSDPSPEAGKSAEVAAAVPAPLMPEATDKKASERPVVGMALPNKPKERPKWAELTPGPKSVAPPVDPVEALLPKPELDFSKAQQSAIYLDENDPNSIYKKFDPRQERIRIIGMSGLLVALVIGGAWYGKWWQYLPLWKKAETAVVGSVAKVGVVTKSSAGTGAAGTVPAGTAKEVPGVVAAPAVTKSVEVAKAVKERKVGVAAEENKSVEAVEPERNAADIWAEGVVEPTKAVAKERTTGKAAAKRGGGSKPGTELSVAEVVPSDAPMLPAKLLKAVNPVYPPNAMLNYITGDVKAEIEVDASGHVGEVKVLSGPKALRAAAVEALKQYEYEPATQGGRGVASKAVVVVKFWFNP